MKKLLITDRQWNQIKAALQFWCSVTEYSRVPPIEHPKVKPFFEDYSPLSEVEIERLSKCVLSTTIDGYTIRQFATIWEWPVIRFRNRLKRMGIQPIGKLGPAKLYRLEDLGRVCDALREYTCRHMTRYERAFRCDETS